MSLTLARAALLPIRHPVRYRPESILSTAVVWVILLVPNGR